MAYAGFFPTKDNKAKLEEAVQREIKRLTQSDAPSLAPTGKQSPRNKYIRSEALSRIKDTNKQKSIMEREFANKTDRKFAPKESRGRMASPSSEKEGN